MIETHKIEGNCNNCGKKLMFGDRIFPIRKKKQYYSCICCSNNQQQIVVLRPKD